MSFEGRYQQWCKNGHYQEYDVYEIDAEKMICSLCGAKIVFQNMIDDTNGGEQGKIEVVVLSLTHCPQCGHITEEICEIPRKRRGKK